MARLPDRRIPRPWRSVPVGDGLADFPFPRPTYEQREATAAAARELVRLRDGWLNPPGLDPVELSKRTLTNLYNARPTWLQHAHAALDTAVLAAYGWPPDLAGEPLLAALLALNLSRDPA